MNCERLREEIQARLDERGTAPPLPAPALAHLGACTECAAYAREVEAVASLLRGAPEEGPPAGFAAGVMERVRAEAPAAPIRRLWPLPLRVAASVAALGIGGFVAWRSLDSENPLEQTVARAPEGAARARPLGTEERARRLREPDRDAEPGVAKPLGPLGYLEDGKRRAEAEKSRERLDDLDAGKRDERRLPAAEATHPPAAAEAKNEAAPPEPAAEPAGLGDRAEGLAARARREAPARKAAAEEELDRSRQAKDEDARSADLGGGAPAPIACVSYSIQVSDAEGAQRIARLAAGYYLVGEDAAALRSQIEKEVSARGILVSPPPTDSQRWTASRAEPQLLNCSVRSEQLVQFDQVLRALPGVSVWRGPDFERIDPAPGGKAGAGSVAAEWEAKELERVVQELAKVQSAERSVADRLGRTKGGKAVAPADGAEAFSAKAAPPASAPAPSPSGPSTGVPASVPATSPALPWVPVRLYLLPSPASQPASGPRK